MVLEFKDIDMVYGKGERSVSAVRNVSLTVNKGDFIALRGKSGCGKSTLLHIAAGYLKPTKGQVLLNETVFSELKDSKKAKVRRRTISFIFQFFNLFPEITIYENIIFPLKIDKRKIDKSEVIELAKWLGIEDKLDRYPGELSGGQQQRVAIARALIMKPMLIIADEPTGNLDEDTSKEVLDLLRKMQNELGQTILMATHDLDVAKYANRIVQMRDGKIMK